MNYLFFGYLAGFLLVAGFVARLALRLGALEQRLSRLAGWVLAAERAGTSYGLRLPGVEIAPGRGDPHRNACLQALALYQEPGR